MFAHASKHSFGVRSSPKAIVFVGLIALVAFLALPSGHALARPKAAGVGVVSYSNNLYAFVVGGDGHLWVDHWNRSSWQWADQGTP